MTEAFDGYDVTFEHCTLEVRETTEEDLAWLAEALGPEYLHRMGTLSDRLAARGEVEEISIGGGDDYRPM